jgi:uncharacterized protein (TIGR03000 family)
LVDPLIPAKENTVNSLRFAPVWVAAALTLIALTPPAARTAGAAAPAQITVIVPADAEVFFDGDATMQKGAERVFVSPPLQAGKTFYYELNARWKEGDKPVDHKRRVDVTAGGVVRVDFTKPERPVADNKAKLTEEEALQIATDAYVYGYPLVTMEVTRRVVTNVEKPAGSHAPMGQFILLREYPTPAFKEVTAPNADTLYASAFFDVGKEPWVLSLPDFKDRYYLMPMLDGWTDVFEDPGTRTTGDKAQTYAITGPGWNGTLPNGVKEYKSPTAIVWLIGRIYCTGTAEDYAAVHKLQDEMRLVPLSAYGKPYTPPPGKVDPSIDTKKTPRDQVNDMDAGAYFRLLAALLKDNPPAKADADMVAKLKKIGIEPGKDFDIGKLDPAVAKGLEAAPKAAQKGIVAHLGNAGEKLNGWVFLKPTGLYGAEYLQRATITYFGLGANRPLDAVYPTAEADADGKPFDGANHYTVTFPKGQMPPVNGFWLVTMYNADYFFAANPLDRYTISQRNKLKENADGSVTVYIQNESPGADKESNWLPAPKGKFILMMRLYWPKEKDPSILNGTWKPPAVTLATK